MITSSLLILLASVAAFLYLRAPPRIHRHGQRLESAPNRLPLLGNAIKFIQPRHVLFDWFVQCQRLFGRETLEISVPSLPPGVIISDPINIEYALKNETLITKGDFFKKRTWDLFGYGIINASGDLWKVQRKAGLKFFAGTNLELMVEGVLPEVYTSIKATLLQAAAEDRQVDMSQWFLDLSTSVVGQMAYDMEIDTSSAFSRAFHYASDHVGLRFQNPLYSITELFTGSQFHEALAEVRRFGKKIVANARTRRSHIAFQSLIENEEPVFNTLIDSLIEALQKPQLVADSALNFLSAGRDTPAQSMTWTLYALLRHPSALTKLREEVDATWSSIKPRTPNANFTFADLQPTKIPYTTAVFYESLRLYPPVPVELKQCESDVTLPDGTFLPKTSIIVWCIWATNRSKETFGDDADEFCPDRWLDAAGNFVGRSAFEFPVFNGGPRVCLGKKMAELMAAFVLLVLLRDWEIEEVRDGPRERVSQNSLTLPMKDGLPCKVRVRGTASP